MPSHAEQLQAIELIAAHESAMGELYQEYASRLADHATLFEKLAADEREHAAAVAGFAARAKEGTGRVGPGPLRAQAVRSSLEFMWRCMDEARASGVTALTALSLAHGLEEAAIEKRFFETGDADPADLRAVMERLATETAAHRALLRGAWDEERQRGR